MGAGASSLSPETFSVAKAEYEAQKEAGLTDEQLFDHMKAFLENMPAPSSDAAAAPAEAAPVEEAPPAEAAPAEEAPPAE